MSQTFTIPATSLRQLISESSPYLVIAELVDIIGELEEYAEGEEDYRWMMCGRHLKVAKGYADEHWKDVER